MQLWTLAKAAQIKVAGAFVIEREVVNMNRNIGCRLLERAGAVRGEVHTAFHQHAAGLQAGNVREIEIGASQVEAEALSCEVVRGSTENSGAVLGELNVLEFGLLSVEAQISGDTPESLAADDCIGELQAAVTVQVRAGTLRLCVKIECAGGGIIVAGGSQDVRQRATLHVEAQIKWAGIGELPVLQSSTEVEIDDALSAVQRAISSGEEVGGEVNDSCEGVPVNLPGRSLYGRRQQYIEIFGLQIAGERNVRQLARGGPGEGSVPSHVDRKRLGISGSGENRLPLA